MRVLHAAAEIFPHVKTGGLADVVAALPLALQAAGADVRVLLPGLPAVMGALEARQPLAELGACFGVAGIRLWRGRLAAVALPVYVVDAPMLYRRDGGPYADARGRDWPDNLQRWGLLGWTAAQLAGCELDPQWTPQVVHGHDWHAALACAYLHAHPVPGVRSVYTVHNLAYQGLFPLSDHALLGLGSALLSADGIEYHGQLSFMKAGLKFADRITTVSPGYAREIATPEFGHGLDGVIRMRGAQVQGILNGIDDTLWDPAQDAQLAAAYGPGDMQGKAACKQALQCEAGLEVRPDTPVLAVVSRLTHQKGLDLVVQALEPLLAQGVQLVVQGSGEADLQRAFEQAAAVHRGQVAAFIGYDEARAHRLFAGADALLVPSRFEPCGLTQLYAMRYGTLPVARRVGGLADTVVDASGEALAGGRATGFLFDEAQAAALLAAVSRLVQTYRDPASWDRLRQAAMAQDHSWRGPAQRYLALYEELASAR